MLTDDPWTSGNLRSGYWHAGINVGVNSRGDDYRHQIQAVADGFVREFEFSADEHLVYCPGASRSQRMVNDIFQQDNSETRNELDCTELASAFHGRVALTLHEYSDALYIVQYAHLYRFGAGGFARETARVAPRRVQAGDVIGAEAGSSYASGTFAESYPVHLHLTIRKFTRADASSEVTRAKGERWRYHYIQAAPDLWVLNRNWHCAPESNILNYCGALRSIGTMVDPETVFAPALSATTAISPPEGAPTYDSADANHVRKADVDNTRVRFVLTSIKSPNHVNPPGPGPIILPTLAYFDIAAGRPHFYSSTAPDAEQRERPGVEGTADGVQGYFAESRNCQTSWSASAWNPATRMGKLSFTSANQYWSEVEPLTLAIPLEPGRSCVITVRGFNDAYGPSDPLPTGAYGRATDGSGVEPAQVIG